MLRVGRKWWCRMDDHDGTMRCTIIAWLGRCLYNCMEWRKRQWMDVLARRAFVDCQRTGSQRKRGFNRKDYLYILSTPVYTVHLVSYK